MKMQTIIESRIRESLNPAHLEVINESDQHIGHAGHQDGDRHFAIVIAAESLNGASRIEAHRKIYALFADLMPEKIHALKIKIM